MPVNQFNLPDVGEGLTEAEIVTWKVKVGDVIKINDIVVEIETAKSLVELPSPYAGTVMDLLVPEGETVAVGTPIIAVGSGDAAAPSPAGDLDIQTPKDDEPVEPGLAGSPAPHAEGRTPTLVGYGPRATSAKRRARTRPVDPSPAVSHASVQLAFQPHATEPVEAMPVEDVPASPVPAVPARPTGGPAPSTALAKPPVRKLAKDLGIDIREVTATGPGGAITRSDVESHVGGVAATTAAAPVGGETRIPIKGVRKMTAQAMVSSAFTAPHVTEWVTLDVTKTMELVASLKVRREFAGLSISPLVIVMRAVCLALKRTPEANATWDDEAQEIVVKHYVNLGIAAATPRGLVVPNVKGAEGQGLRELAESLGELVATARSGKTQPEQMSGGTFTITNVGVFGVDSGTPILNPGESGILCFGAIKKHPWVVGDQIIARDVTTLALSFDHRIVDGEQGSRFLADVASILENPANAMLF